MTERLYEKNVQTKLLDYAYMIEHKKEIKQRLLVSGDFVKKRIAVLCGGTFGNIKDFLEIFLLFNGIEPIFYIGSYNRFYEEACFENDSLADFDPEIIILHICNRDLLCRLDEFCEETLLNEKKRLMNIWDSLEERYKCVLIQNNFEYYPYRMVGNGARRFSNGSIRYINQINEYIDSHASKHKDFYVNDIHYLSSFQGLSNWYDDRIWNLYKYPMSMDMHTYYAKSLADIIKSICGKNKKLVITDLDNTLWGGTIGECGEEGIRVGDETARGSEYEKVQRYLKYLANNGVILAACSKNDHDIGMKGIRSIKSPLEESDFTTTKINWDLKSKNIYEIIDEVNLTQDAVIFIDDDPVECDSVKQSLQNIEVIDASNSENLLREIDNLNFFELSIYSKEDMDRTKLYRENANRINQRKNYENYDDYLRSLKMECVVDIVNDRNIDRCVQLLNKTNQFNFMTERYSIDKLNEKLKSEIIRSLVLTLNDKFGTNGIVSLAIIRLDTDAIYIDDWIMSCRVFKRGLEYAMLSLICEECRNNKIIKLYGQYRMTEKNRNLRSFFDEEGFVKIEESNGLITWICEDIEKLKQRCDERIYMSIVYNLEHIKM